MKYVVLSLVILLFNAWCYVAFGQEVAKPPKLTDQQYLALRHARDAQSAALDKLKATPEYQAYLKSLEEGKKATEEALKGIDPKKWTLGPDLEIVAVPTAK